MPGYTIEEVLGQQQDTLTPTPIQGKTIDEVLAEEADLGVGELSHTSEALRALGRTAEWAYSAPARLGKSQMDLNTAIASKAGGVIDPATSAALRTAVEQAQAPITSMFEQGIKNSDEVVEEFYQPSKSISEGSAFQPGNSRWWIASGVPAVAQGAAMVAGGALAGPGLALGAMGAMSGGTAASDISERLQALKTYGFTDDDIAILAASGGLALGTVEALLEKLPLDEALSTAARQGIMRTVLGSGKSLPSKLARTAAAEGIEEVGSGEAGRAWQRVAEGDPTAYDNAWSERAGEIAGGVIGGTAMGVPAGVAGSLQRRELAKRNELWKQEGSATEAMKAGDPRFEMEKDVASNTEANRWFNESMQSEEGRQKIRDLAAKDAPSRRDFADAGFDSKAFRLRQQDRRAVAQGMAAALEKAAPLPPAEKLTSDDELGAMVQKWQTDRVTKSEADRLAALKASVGPQPTVDEMVTSAEGRTPNMDPMAPQPAQEAQQEAVVPPAKPSQPLVQVASRLARANSLGAEKEKSRLVEEISKIETPAGKIVDALETDGGVVLSVQRPILFGTGSELVQMPLDKVLNWGQKPAKEALRPKSAPADLVPSATTTEQPEAQTQPQKTGNPVIDSIIDSAIKAGETDIPAVVQRTLGMTPEEFKNILKPKPAQQQPAPAPQPAQDASAAPPASPEPTVTPEKPERLKRVGKPAPAQLDGGLERVWNKLQTREDEGASDISARRNYTKRFIGHLNKKLGTGQWVPPTAVLGPYAKTDQGAGGAARDLGELEAAGAVQRAWDKDGNTYYALPGVSLDPGLTQSDEAQAPQAAAPATQPAQAAVKPKPERLKKNLAALATATEAKPDGLDSMDPTQVEAEWRKSIPNAPKIAPSRTEMVRQIRAKGPVQPAVTEPRETADEDHVGRIRESIANTPALKGATVEEHEDGFTVTTPDGGVVKVAPIAKEALAKRASANPENMEASAAEAGVDGESEVYAAYDPESDTLYLAPGFTHDELSHEVVHHLQKRGVITKEDEKLFEKDEKSWMDEIEDETPWGERRSRERIAYAYQAWVRDGRPKTGHGMFEKIYDYISALIGSKSAKQRQLFRKIDTGKLTGLDPKQAKTVARVVDRNVWSPDAMDELESEGELLFAIRETVAALKGLALGTTNNEKTFWENMWPRGRAEAEAKPGAYKSVNGLNPEATEKLAATKPADRDKVSVFPYGAAFDKFMNTEAELKKIVDEMIKDVIPFLRKKGKHFLEYYSKSVAKERAILLRAFPELKNKAMFELYRILNANASAQTELSLNTRETADAWSFFREAGDDGKHQIPLYFAQDGKDKPKPMYRIPTFEDLPTASQQQLRELLKEFAGMRDREDSGDKVSREKPEGMNAKDWDSELAKWGNQHGKKHGISSGGQAVRLFWYWLDGASTDSARDEKFLSDERIPFIIHGGTSAFNKAYNYRAINTLLYSPELEKELGITKKTPFPKRVEKVVEWLKGTTTYPQLQKNRALAGFGASGSKSEIVDTVYVATGQEEAIPRTFIFGPKVGAYMINRLGDEAISKDKHGYNASDFNTMDVWESRVWRSVTGGLFDDEIGIANGIPRRVYMRLAKLYAQEWSKNEEVAKSFPKHREVSVSSGQASRWYMGMDAAGEAGYSKVDSEKGTISEYTALAMEDHWRQNIRQAAIIDPYGLSPFGFEVTGFIADLDNAKTDSEKESIRKGFWSKKSASKDLVASEPKTKQEKLKKPERGESGIPAGYVDSDGNVELYHYSEAKADEFSLDPDEAVKHRRGYSKNEFESVKTPRTFAYINQLDREPDVTGRQYTTKVPADKIYNLSKDSQGLKKKYDELDKNNKLDRVLEDLKSQGYLGTYDFRGGGRVVQLLSPVDVKLGGGVSPKADPAKLWRHIAAQIAKGEPAGFTLDTKTGEMVTSGWAVADSKGTERKLELVWQNDTAARGEFIRDYIGQMAGRLGERQRYIGAWVSDNHLVMDIPTVIPERHVMSAVKIAIDNDQDAIFNLKTFEEVKTKDMVAELKDIKAKKYLNAGQKKRAVDKFWERTAKAVSEVKLSEDAGKDFVEPKKTVKAYKIFDVRDGKLYPMFIGANKETEIGTWMPGEYLPTAGFADRPGWHAGHLPSGPQLRTKAGKMNQGRVWAEVEMPDDVDWQTDADKTKDKDIGDRVPDGGHYKWNRKDGTKWLIGGGVKVVRVLRDAEVRKILEAAGEAEAAKAEQHDDQSIFDTLPPEAFGPVKETEDLGQQIKDNISALAKRLGTGLSMSGLAPLADPEVRRLVKEIVKDSVKLGVAKFSDFVSSVKEELGEKTATRLMPQLKAGWKKWGPGGAKPGAYANPKNLGAGLAGRHSAKPAKANKHFVSGMQPVEMPELFALAEALIGKGKVQARKIKGALGRFVYHKNGDPVAIRINRGIGQNPDALSAVLAHEVGHLIDFAPDGTMARGNLLGRLRTLRNFFNGFGQKLSDVDKALNEEVKDELIDLTKWWSGDFDKDAPEAAYRTSPRELYAEALSVMLNTPGELRLRAPVFYREFMAYLDQKPEVLNGMIALQDLLNGSEEKLLDQRAERIAEMFDSGEKAWTAARTAQEAARRNIFTTIKDFIGGMLLDYHNPTLRRMNAAGYDDTDERNAKYALDELNYKDSANYKMLRDLQRNVMDPLLNAGLTKEDIGKFLFLNRVSAGDRWKFVNPQGYTPKEAIRTLKLWREQIGDAKYDTIRKLSDAFHDVVWRSVEAAAEAGVYSSDKVNEMRKEKNQYATFAVVKYIEDTFIGSGLYKQVGTFEDVANPFDATVMKMFTLNRLNAINSAKRKLRDAWQGTPELAKDFVEEKIPYGKDKPNGKPAPGKDWIYMLEDGKLRAYEVPTEVAQGFDKMDLRQLSNIVSFFQSSIYPLFHKLYIAWAPGFMAANPFRDLRRTHKNLATTDGISLGKLLTEYFKAMPSAWRKERGIKDDDIDAMFDEKVFALSWAKMDPDDATKGEFERMLAEHGMAEKKPANWVEKLVDMTPGIREIDSFLTSLSGTMENATKIAAWRILKEKGVPEHERAYKVRKYVGTPDFKQKGHLTPVTNAILMFSKVRWVGLQHDIGLATNPKTAAGWWFRTAAWTILPAIATRYVLAPALAAAFGWDDDEEKDAERLISNYFWNTYDVIPMGFSQDGDDVKARFLTIPRDDVGRFVVSFLNHVIDIGKESAGKDTKHGSVGSAMQSLASEVQGELIPNLNPVLDVAYRWSQYAAGINPLDPHFNSQIVPQSKWKAGGMNAARPMISWTVDKAGVAGQVIHLFGDPLATEGETIEIKDLHPKNWPGISRLYRESNSGLNEMKWLEFEADEREAANFKLGLPKAANDLARERYMLTRTSERTPEEEARRRMLNRWSAMYYEPLRAAIKQAEAGGGDTKTLKDDLRNASKGLVESKEAALQPLSELSGPGKEVVAGMLKVLEEDLKQKPPRPRKEETRAEYVERYVQYLDDQIDALNVAEARAKHAGKDTSRIGAAKERLKRGRMKLAS